LLNLLGGFEQGVLTLFQLCDLPLDEIGLFSRARRKLDDNQQAY
jgi:hypothetical protein